MKENNQNLEAFKAFMQTRLKASTDYVEGKFEPLKDISVSESPATIFPPPGICVQGADEVNRVNEKGAANFLPGAKNDFEIMHMAADTDLAYWVGIQRSTVRMQGQDREVVFNLRVTEIFRKENGAWKLMHRHADKLVEQ